MPSKRNKSKSPASPVPNSTPTSTPTPIPPAINKLFIVEDILAKYEVHLVGGPSHAGKTTLLLQIIDRWRQGRDVFGHESHPAPFCYVACERSTGYIKAILNRIGIDPETFPCVSAVDYEGINTFDDVYALARRKTPNLEVLFLDGIHCICGGKTNDDMNVGMFLRSITRRLVDLGLTVIGVGNSTKVKGDERFSNPCERFRGSSVWGTGSATMIVVERSRNDELRNPKRTVMVIADNAADQVLNYSLDSRGMFQPDIEEPTRFDEFAEMVLCREPGDIITRQEMLETASYVGDEGIPERSVNNYIKRLMEENRLEREKWGAYKIPVRH